MPEGGTEASVPRFVVDPYGVHPVVRDTVTGTICVAVKGDWWAVEVAGWLNQFPCYAINFAFVAEVGA